MRNIIKMTRRGFIRAAGLACGYAVLSVNMTKEAMAAALAFVEQRQKHVYDADRNNKLYEYKKSQDNPMITALYDKQDGFLHEGPCGHMSHRLLHTDYIDRSARVKALKAKGYKLAL
ncbi:MAG: ferredoxin hydrogenase small subunit [Desulfovibrionales bacterium]|nr:ferredoxin hydrogenase small subunit [Desulfovibrionales bacterium]